MFANVQNGYRTRSSPISTVKRELSHSVSSVSSIIYRKIRFFGFFTEVLDPNLIVGAECLLIHAPIQGPYFFLAALGFFPST